MTTTNKWLIVTLSVLTTLSSCKSDKTKQNGRDSLEIEHELGTSGVTRNPERVVVFDMGSLETMDKMNIPIAGMPKDYVPRYLKRYQTNEDVQDAGSVLQPNFEKISKINPDLIVISTLQAKDYDKLSSIAPTVYLGIKNDDFSKSVNENIHTLGQIFKMEDKTDLINREIQDKISAAANTITASGKKIMILLYNAGTFSTFGSKSRYGFVYNDLKAVPVDDNTEVAVHGTVVSSEYIAKKNPDILYIIDRNSIMNKYNTNKAEIVNSLIKKTAAFKNNKIIFMDPDVWYLSGGGVTSINRMIDDILKGYK